MNALKQRAMARVGRMLGRSATVARVRSLTPRVRAITLQGDDLRGLAFRPGQKIKLRVGDVMRSYTPAWVDARSGSMEVVFHLHGTGPAADWAGSVEPGAETWFVGPARSMPELASPVDWALFLGDETTLGLAAALLGDLPADTPVLGAIETAPEDAPALAALQLPLDCALRGPQHGDALSSWLSERLQAGLPPGRGQVWLSGEATSVLVLRNTLLQHGLPREQLAIKPYWSVKGHAHRKALGKQL